MAISASLIKELRERTGLGMIECKKALDTANGDIEKAIETLRKSGQAKAAKKAARTASEGIVIVKISPDYTHAVMAEINSETDFVARDENFLSFANSVINQYFSDYHMSLEALQKETEEERQALIQKIGENISIRRIASVEGNIVNSYIHGNQRIAVLIGLEGGNKELAKDIAMHIAASRPEVITPDDMPEDLIAKEKEIFQAQAEKSGKPEKIIEQIVSGQVKKFLSENSLTEQPFVKNSDVKVGQLVADANAKIMRFVRFEVGEGITKENVNFADEVAAQLKNKS